MRRVLHVFGVMDRGGAETRTLEVMRRAVGRGYTFDFCVLGARAGVYAPEIARLGGRVLPCPLASRPLTFPVRLYRLLSDGGYDAVHSHVHQFSGVILLVARAAGVRTRIAHVRSSDDGRRPTPFRRLYRAAMRALVERHATRVVGVSASAMHAFWGPGWMRDRRKVVIYNGVEAAGPAGAPERAADRAAVRRELGLGPESRIVLHVGRFAPAKNHAGLVAIAAPLLARRADAALVLVGDGPLRPAIAAAIAARGLAPRTRLLGARDDVPRLLRAADVLVHPSRWEGLPGAVLEALAAGLPVVASAIPPVLEIAHHVAGVTLADPADPLGFAHAVEMVLAAPATAETRVGPLPGIFHAGASTERLLACYR